jgi:hypothetical protein
MPDSSFKLGMTGVSEASILCCWYSKYLGVASIYHLSRVEIALGVHVILLAFLTNAGLLVESGKIVVWPHNKFKKGS